jgi:hypothetical protein
MKFISIPPDKVSEFEALKVEFDQLNKSIESLANAINATKPFHRDLFLNMREMQKRQMVVLRQMTHLSGEKTED